jgi:hypothetical protein
MGLGRNLLLLLHEAKVRTSLAQWPALTVDQFDVARVTIDMLTDVALNIFDFYLEEGSIDHLNKPRIEVWRRGAR